MHTLESHSEPDTHTQPVYMCLVLSGRLNTAGCEGLAHETMHTP